MKFKNPNVFQVIKDIYKINLEINKIEFTTCLFLALLSGIIDLFSLAVVLPILNIIFVKDIENQYLPQSLLSYASLLDNKFLLIIISVSFFISLAMIRVKCFEMIFKKLPKINNNIFQIAYKSALHQNNNISLKTPEKLSLLIDGSESFQNILALLVQLVPFLVISLLSTLTLFIINPIIFFMSFVFILTIYIFIYRYAKPLLKDNSSGISENYPLRLLLAKETISNSIQINLYSLIDHSAKRLTPVDEKCREFVSKNYFLSMFAKPIVEYFAISIILLFSFYLFQSGNNVSYEATIIKIGFLLLVIQKIILNFNSLFAIWASIKGRFIFTNKYLGLVKEYKKKKIYVIRERLNWKKISLEDISFIYPRNEFFTLEDINLEIISRQNICITGRSGCGKSTLSEIIMCLIKPSKGNIYLDNVDIYSKGERFINAWQSEISCVPQEEFFMDDTFLENLIAYNPNYKIDQDFVSQILKKAKIYLHGPTTEDSADRRFIARR